MRSDAAIEIEIQVWNKNFPKTKISIDQNWINSDSDLAKGL